jgi:geranyl-CoA carboxylase alpha subunit
MAFRAANRQARARSVRVSPELNGWGSGGSLVSPVTFVDEDGEANLTVRPVGAAYSVADGQSNREVEVDDDDGQRAEVQVDGRRHVAIYHHDVDGRTWLSLGGVTSVFVRPGAGGATASATGGDGRVAAPMHGVLQAVLVEAGQSVTAGQPLAVIEAMKMQHEISAPIEGEVAAVHGKVGIQMAAGDPILEVRPERVDTMGH